MRELLLLFLSRLPQRVYRVFDDEHLRVVMVKIIQEEIKDRKYVYILKYSFTVIRAYDYNILDYSN